MNYNYELKCIELENKKNPQKADSAEFRKEIVEKIENEIN